MELVFLIAIALIALAAASIGEGDPGPRRGATLSGKAYVTDGDGIRVDGHEVRLAGLDAPEWEQVAQHGDGYWFEHGKQVKSELIRAIGGEHVHVTVHGRDRYGRIIGTVTCNGHDVGEWLVEHGYAIAAYGDQYKHVEEEARQAGRGMWGHATSFDPRSWRQRWNADGSRGTGPDVGQPGRKGMRVIDRGPPESLICSGQDLVIPRSRAGWA